MKKIFYPGMALLCLPFAAMAQSGAADPAVPAPTVSYRSVFADTPRGVEAQSLDWKGANAEVGQNLRGHIDILKWEAAQAKADAAKPPTPIGTPAQPEAVKP